MVLNLGEKPRESSKPSLAGAARDEKSRFKAILEGSLEKRESGLFVCIPRAGGEPLACPLPRKNRDDPVRAWALSSFIDQYGANGKIANYAAALADIWLDSGEPTPEGSGGEEKRERGRPKSQRSQAVEQALTVIQGANDYCTPASNPGAFYMRVPYLPGNPDDSALYTGLWHVTEKTVTRLTDMALYPLKLTRPHAASKSVNFSGTLRAVNARGREMTVEFDREALDKGLDAKFKGFASWPELPTNKYRLYEALNSVFQSKDVIIHDSQDSLGWALVNGELQWIANNGIETALGFVSSERARIVAPNLKTGGNGYRADGEKRPLSSDIWEMYLEGLNSLGSVRRLAKLGAFARVLFPEETIEKAGVLKFVIETVGDGTGQGKSAEDNYLLSLSGLDFSWDRGTFLTEKDTFPSRARVMERTRYCLFADYDRKARPGNRLFDNQHESRKSVITQYADETGGGLKMVDHGRDEAQRGTAQGGLLLTGNYDHAQHSLSQPELSEESYEFRACTFVLSREETASREVSVAIDARRGELYAWGRAFRRWIMRQYNRDRAALTLRVQQWRAQAERAERELDYPWNHYRQQNAAIDLVWGLYAWAAFLEDMVKDYANHYLYKFIQGNIVDVLCDRMERDDYLQGLVNKREGGVDIGEFVLQATRNILGESRGYVVSQQDKLLEESDVAPYSLTSFGYKHINTGEGESWQTGGVKLGYYLGRRAAIAFKFDMLYPRLEDIAQRSRYRLPPLPELKSKLLEAGIVECMPTKIAGKTQWTLLVMPLGALGVEARELVDVEDEKRTEELLGEVDKIISLASRKPAPPAAPAAPAQVVAQGDLSMPSGATFAARSSDPFDIDETDLRNFDPMA